MNKKTVMTTLIIAGFLVSMAAEMQNMQETKANFALTPSTPPTVSIVSPANSSTQPHNVIVVFNATFHNITLLGSAIPYRIEFYCRLDHQPSTIIQPIILSSNTTQNSESSQSESRQCKFSLQNLTDGLHNIQVSAKIGRTQSTDNDVTWNFVGIEGYSDIVNFTVEDILTPKVSILYPNNNSFFNVSLEGVSFYLTYESNNVLSWVGYSLGGKGYSIEGKGSGNVTLSENGTLVRDFGSSGYHTLTLYANDTSGNWATPQTVTYLVNFYPEYTPVSSSSPTLQPTSEPSPSPAIPEFPSWAILPILSLILALITSTIYNRNKGRENE